MNFSLSRPVTLALALSPGYQIELTQPREMIRKEGPLRFSNYHLQLCRTEGNVVTASARFVIVESDGSAFSDGDFIRWCEIQGDALGAIAHAMADTALWALAETIGIGRALFLTRVEVESDARPGLILDALRASMSEIAKEESFALLASPENVVSELTSTADLPNSEEHRRYFSYLVDGLGLRKPRSDARILLAPSAGFELDHDFPGWSLLKTRAPEVGHVR